MKFEKALKKMREGHHVTRQVFQPNISYTVEEGKLVCYSSPDVKNAGVTLSGISILADDWYVVDHGDRL